MTVHHQVFQVQSKPNKENFHDVSKEVDRVLAESGIANGILTVYSQHTTCSVMIQEEAHDETFHGTKYLLQDMLDVFEKIIPKCTKEGQYMHPGPAHIKHATENLDEEAVWSLNTDAHLRSSMIGRSETIPIIDGKLELGIFGVVYFIDFDTVRARERNVHIQIVGE